MELEHQSKQTEVIVRLAERRLRAVMRQVYNGLSQDIENGAELPIWMQQKRGGRIIINPGTPTNSGIALKRDGSLVRTRGVIQEKNSHPKDLPIKGFDYLQTGYKLLSALRLMFEDKR